MRIAFYITEINKLTNFYINIIEQNNLHSILLNNFLNKEFSQ
jgi:hypothetical protein